MRCQWKNLPSRISRKITKWQDPIGEGAGKNQMFRKMFESKVEQSEPRVQVRIICVWIEIYEHIFYVLKYLIRLLWVSKENYPKKYPKSSKFKIVYKFNCLPIILSYCHPLDFRMGLGDHRNLAVTRKCSNESIKTMFKRSQSPIFDRCDLPTKVTSKRGIERPQSRWEQTRYALMPQ